MEENENEVATESPQQTELSPYQQRLRVEEAELKEKIGKLYDFTQGEQFSNLPDYPKQMLVIQLDAMRTYNRVLSYRVSNNF